MSFFLDFMYVYKIAGTFYLNYFSIFYLIYTVTTKTRSDDEGEKIAKFICVQRNTFFPIYQRHTKA